MQKNPQRPIDIFEHKKNPQDYDGNLIDGAVSPKSTFLSRYPGPKGGCQLTIKDGIIETKSIAIIDTFCFISRKKPTNIIKCCAGYTIKNIGTRCYIKRKF